MKIVAKINISVVKKLHWEGELIIIERKSKMSKENFQNKRRRLKSLEIGLEKKR